MEGEFEGEFTADGVLLKGIHEEIPEGNPELLPLVVEHGGATKVADALTHVSSVILL